jgi:thioredoxin-like negative regulator of GroEL
MVRTVPEAVAQQHRNTVRILKLNVYDSPAVARRYGITGIPTLILFQDGVEKERIVGVASQVHRQLSAKSSRPWQRIMSSPQAHNGDGYANSGFDYE